MLHAVSNKSSHTYEEQTKFPHTDVQNQPEKTYKQKKWNKEFKSFLGWKRKEINFWAEVPAIHLQKSYISVQ